MADIKAKGLTVTVKFNQDDVADMVKKLVEQRKLAPIIHAHWVYNPNANDWGIGGWCCSKCHYKNDAIGVYSKPNFPISMIAGTRFCGNCGALMDEEVADGDPNSAQP